MMEGKNSTLETLVLGLVLAAYALVACTVLALVNNVTAPKIAANKEMKAKSAMAGVMPDADDFSAVENFRPSSNPAVTVQSVHEARKGGKTIGGVAQVSGPTYDKATIIVGVNVDGTVSGLKFLEISDSPGFGLKAGDPTFTLPSGKTFCAQFEGKDARAGFKAGETFDSISGATITSVGVAELVSEGSASIIQSIIENGGSK